MMADTTANRGYPYPESTDTIDVPGDMQTLADAIDADVQGLSVPAYSSDPGAIQSGFSLWANGAKGWLGLDGKLVTIWLDVNNASTLTPTSGNLADVTCYILDADYRPDADTYIPFAFNTGAAGGTGQIGPDGVVSLQGAYGTIASGSHIRIYATYQKA